MKFTIDFKYFIFECLHFKFTDGSIFSYKTSNNKFYGTFSEFLRELKWICSKCLDLKCIGKDKNRMPMPVLKKEKLDKIRMIYENSEHGANTFDQIVNNELAHSVSAIWKLRLHKGSRLFYTIFKSENNKWKFMPLFIDVNHVIFNDESIKKSYRICLNCFHDETQNC